MPNFASGKRRFLTTDYQGVFMSKISIALCTYNGGKFLSEQLESFTNQIRLPDELVIGDDCSTDETLKIIENFKNASPFPVRLTVNERNLGSTENFERTIARCKGDIIFLSDQDDVWISEKISVIENEFNKNVEVGLVFSNADLIGENGELLGLNLWEFTLTEEEKNKIKENKSFEVLLNRNVITGATMAFRAELQTHFMPLSLNITNLIHDGRIALISSLYSKIEFVDKSLILYRQHGSQQIGVRWKTKKFNAENSKSPLAGFSSKLKINYDKREKRLSDSIEFSLKEIERIRDTAAFLKQTSTGNLPSKQLNKISDEFIADKFNQIAHYKARNSLPKNRLKRLLPLMRETLTSRYHLFSRGFYSVGKDLLEKWK